MLKLIALAGALALCGCGKAMEDFPGAYRGTATVVLASADGSDTKSGETVMQVRKGTDPGVELLFGSTDDSCVVSAAVDKVNTFVFLPRTCPEMYISPCRYTLLVEAGRGSGNGDLIEFEYWGSMFAKCNDGTSGTADYNISFEGSKI
jgi:hypothetical protein